MLRSTLCFSFVFLFSVIVTAQDCFTVTPNNEKNSLNNLPQFSLAELKYSDTTSVNLKTLAEKMSANASGTFEKVRHIIWWTNQNLNWNFTDYKSRTAKEILCQKGGNCAEQASVVKSLLTEIGIKTRKTVEINIQPAKAQRQKDAEKRIQEIGNRGSVFGNAHNDHVWIEFFDEEQQQWIPADATLGLVGLENWTEARIGFQKRIVHDIIPSADMLAPIAVLVMDVNRKITDNRSAYYLIEAFDKVYQGQLSKLPSWTQWKQSILFIQDKAMKAFQGEVNLHEYAVQIQQVGVVYQQLKNEYCQMIQNKVK